MDHRDALAYSILLLLVIVFMHCTKSVNPETEPKGTASEIQVPEGFHLEVAAGPELVDYPMFATLDETGRLFVFESIGNVYPNSQAAIDTPRFRIKLLVDENADGLYDRSTIFADSLSFPQGGVFYKGSLYASSAPDLLKLTDTDDDGIADKKEIILSGWILNVNANSLIGPFMGPDGWLYLTSAIMGFDVTTKEGEMLKGETARIWRVKPDGSELEWISAGGMNNPIELSFTPSGEVIGTQTFFVHPQRGLRDALTFWVEGGVYGKETQDITRDQLPRTGELMPVITPYSRVAPSGLGLYRSTTLGKEFQNNLFSAQFNTHSVIRHRLIRDGGSFKTEDSPFFWSGNEDIHPTDVLEDGDGSLMVIETGGWFIKGCPLSQVSKPQLKGSIYRIRRDGAPGIDDPFGNDILWESLDIEALTNLLYDDRPFVVDRAIQALIDRGEEAIALLGNQIMSDGSDLVRLRSVFALYRIGTQEALSVIRSAFNHPNQEVRVAAARSMGLAKDSASIDALIGELGKDSEAGRRQAASALGQIGSQHAVPHLLNAVQNEDDRFVIHAIIHSLILINQPALILPGLIHESREVKKAAIIAMDQMPNSILNFNHVIPFLESSDQTLQQTGLWVASHHPEWSSKMIIYLQDKIESPGQDEKSRGMVKMVLTAFCEREDIQRFITSEFKIGDQTKKLFLLEIMSDCQVEPFPDGWTKSMKTELSVSKDMEIKSKLIDLIRFRRINSLADLLLRESNDPENAHSIRVNAIAIILQTNPVITPQHFAYLFEILQSTENVQLRQQVASALGSADLSEMQLLEITRSYLPKADNFILPRLLPLFHKSQNLDIGQALISVLLESPGLYNFTEDQIRSLFVNYPVQINDDLELLVTKLNDARSDRLGKLSQIEENIKNGDEGRGRGLYFGKATCWTCHTMGEEGGDFGPDLTSIQKDRSAHDILEAILYPSVSFVREFETYHITTSSGKFTGIIQEQSPHAIILGTAPLTSIRIERDEIIQMELSDVSMMPQGLGEMLTDEELVDLLAFLLGNDLTY